jgi:uncharacterized protein YjbI with pentapeptide repeats
LASTRDGSNLRRARLLETRFRLDASMRNVTLTRSTVVRSTFFGADLSGSQLGMAELIRTKFAKAEVTGASFRGSTCAGSTRPDDLLQARAGTSCHSTQDAHEPQGCHLGPSGRLSSARSEGLEPPTF